MICPKCQGKRGYPIGPQPHDWRDCSECGGSGTIRRSVLPGYGGLAGFKETAMPDKSQHAITTSLGKQPTFSAMDEILRESDKAFRDRHEQHMEQLASAQLRGVRIVADHRLRDGEIAILVSAEDYRRLIAYSRS